MKYSFSWQREEILEKGVLIMLYIMGDSHSIRFDGAKDKDGNPIKVRYITPTTAHNLCKHHPEIEAAFVGITKDDTVFFIYGEGDVRIHFYLHSIQDGIPEEELMYITAERYVSTVNVYKPRCKELKIMAIIPQGDEENIYGAAFYASREHRQKLTVAFNRILQDVCNKYSIPFVDIWKGNTDIWPIEWYQEDRCHLLPEIAVKYLEDWLKSGEE